MEEKKKKISDAFSYSSRLSEEDGSQLGIGIGIGNKKKHNCRASSLSIAKKKKKEKKKEKGRFTSGTGRKECWCLVGLVSRLCGMVDVVNSISTTTLEHGGF